MHEGLQKVFDVLPNKCNKIFIAGGAAADFDLAADVDVWIPGNSITAGIELFNAIHLPKRACYSSKKAKYTEDKEQDFTLIGEFYFEPINKMVQILVARGTITQILNRFDLSIHQIAYTRDGASHHSMYWTTTKTPIEITRINKSTFGRYIKLCKRYGLKPDPYKLDLYWPEYGVINLPEETDEDASKNQLDTLSQMFGSPFKLGYVSATTTSSPGLGASWATVDTSPVELKLAENMKQAKSEMMKYIIYGKDPKSGKSEK